LKPFFTGFSEIAITKNVRISFARRNSFTPEEKLLTVDFQLCCSLANLLHFVKRWLACCLSKRIMLPKLNLPDRQGRKIDPLASLSQRRKSIQ